MADLKSYKSFRDFLEAHRVGDLLKAEADREPLIFVKSTDRVPEVLKVLCDKHISAVPVFDEDTKEWVGIVEMLDFVTVVTLLSNVKSLVDAFSTSGPVPEADYVDQEAKVIMDCQVGEFASQQDLPKRNPLRFFDIDHSLEQLMAIFSKELNKHRVCVKDGDEVVAVLSQFGVLKFLHGVLPNYPHMASKKLSEWHSLSDNVLFVLESDSAIDAFNLLIEKKVTGLAVVNDDGKLVGSISASDLKGSTGKDLFSNLKLSVRDYLKKAAAFFGREGVPVAVSSEATLTEIMDLLIKNHLHRLFVVDEAGKPIQVLSLTDIITFLWASWTEEEVALYAAAHPEAQ